MTAHYDKWLEAHLEEVINLYQEYRADTGDEETKPSEFAEDLYKFLPGEAEGGTGLGSTLNFVSAGHSR